MTYDSSLLRAAFITPFLKGPANIGALSADPHGQKQWPRWSGLPLQLLTNIHIENYTSKYVDT